MKRSLRRATLVALCFASLASPQKAAAQSADLLILTAPVGSIEAIRGVEDTVAVTIRNVGSAATATTFDVTVYLSVDENPSSIEKVGDLAVSTSLGVNETRVIQVPVRIPSLQALGSHLWLTEVDVANVIAEDDENNNGAVGNAINIQLTPPDFIVSSIPSGPLEVALGTTVTVSTAIQNIGAGSSSSPFDISVYLSVDDVLDGDDTLVGRVALPDVVLSNETRSINLLATVSPDFPERDYKWIVAVNVEGGGSQN